MTKGYLFSGPPALYGSLYLLLIPLYAAIYFFIPNFFSCEKDLLVRLVDSLYFSAVTITTLGYGDITPTEIVSKIFASSEAVLGITLIGLFLNSLAHRRDLQEAIRSREARVEEELHFARSQLKSHDSLIELRINVYEESARIISNPMISGEMIDGKFIPPPISQYNQDFSLSDLRDLYHPSLHQLKNVNKTNVHYHLQAQKELLNEIIDLVKETELFRWEELQSECIGFIQTIESLDASENILAATTMTMGSEKYTKSVSDMLESHTGEALFLESNAINPYVALYHSIKYTMAFISSYKQHIANEFA